MKKLILAITTLFAIAANSQVKTTDATAPIFNDGTIKVDTAGTGIKTWAVYKVANGFRQDPEIAKDFSTVGNLTLGTYWVLGKRKSDGLSKFSLDTLINITIAVAKNCDSLKVSYFNAIQMPDPQNPQMQSTCISYSVSKATNPSIDKIYLQEWNGMISQYFGPSQGGCYPNMAQNAKIHAVITDVNGCSVVGTNATDYKPTNYPVMTVPGTEPGPITNHVTIGVADCSGYYIHYNDVQYKICNSGAARGMVHLDSIVVSGKFVADCNYQDTVVYCQMYHPHAGYFWLDSMRAIAPKPANKNCWDDYKLDSLYFWTNAGKQPIQPTDTNYSYQFDSIKCAWNNIGPKDTTTMSIGTLKLDTKFSPNPFTDRLDVNIPQGSHGTITTIDGKTLMTFDSNERNLNTEALEPGTYFITVTRGRETTSIKAMKAF